MHALLQRTGIVHAVCWAVIDCGEQTWWFNGQPSTMREVRIAWELLDETTRSGARRVLTRRYRRSMWPTATLRRHIVSWLGEARFVFHVKQPDAFHPEGGYCIYDFKPLLGRGAKLELQTQPSGYQSVTNVTPLEPTPTLPERPLLLFDLEHFDVEAFHRIPETVRDHIMRSPTFLALHGMRADPPEFTRPATAAELIDDEVPW